MSLYVITVTYGDRIEFLKTVVSSLIQQDVDKIIVVSNGCDKNSALGINDLITKNPDLIEQIDLGENTGSANGFSIGIEYAYSSGAEFLWLLDDDNNPQFGAIEVLKNEWLFLK